ncbi:putative Mast/stem cell growth factor receptor Kit [Hypsibius exemplaris]|uniref:Mast/stem cell growth factor receptor Kit n=1 Tax=Hypsibius exemplaris TaxID=2072580 RepID=A0A9X6NB71_HYPEX|nr:putative Mast/stem cell growth factor receptor Kit [Hypsibius exemplaris]
MKPFQFVIIVTTISHVTLVQAAGDTNGKVEIYSKEVGNSSWKETPSSFDRRKFWSVLDTVHRQKPAVINGPFNWSDGKVPYTVAEGISEVHWPTVLQLMQHVADETRNCVSFVERSSVSDLRNSVPDHPSSIPDLRNSVTDLRSSVPDHPSSVPDHPSSVTDHPSSVTDLRSSVLDHRSSVTDHRSSITDDRSSVTDHRSDFVFFHSRDDLLSAYTQYGRTGGMQAYHVAPYSLEMNRPKQLSRLLNLLGMQAEVTRPDRNLFVSINWRDVRHKSEGRRSILTALPFDYDSATNAIPFDEDSFAEMNGSIPIIVSKSTQMTLKNDGTMSPLDVARLLLAYKCFNHSAVYEALRYGGLELGPNPSGALPGDWEGYVQPVAPAIKPGLLHVGPIRKDATGLGDFLNWSKGRVPTVIDPAFPADLSALLRDAMQDFTAATNGCITFPPRTREPDYVRFVLVADGEGDTWVGRHGGEQAEEFGPVCLHRRGCFHTRLLSILGFSAEVFREDRDDYVWMNWGNVIEKKKDAEAVTRDLPYNPWLERSRFGLPYDYASVLQYAWNKFTNDTDEPFVIPKRKGQYLSSPTGGVSVLDQARLLLGYQCLEPEQVKRKLASVGVTVDPTFPESAEAFRDRLARENKTRVINKLLDDIGDLRPHGVANGRFVWRDGRVPYTVDRKLDPIDVALVFSQMEQISNATRGCIQFTPRRNESDYLHLAWTDGDLGIGGAAAASGPGRRTWYFTPYIRRKYGVKYLFGFGNGRYQLLWYLLELLGFTAEFRRPDRGKYVTINPDTIRIKVLRTAVAIDQSPHTMWLPYDYQSVTNWAWFGLSTQNISQINLKPSAPYVGADRTEMLSYLDVAKLLWAYQCAEPTRILAALRANNLLPVEDLTGNRFLAPAVGASLGAALILTIIVCANLFRRRRRRNSGDEVPRRIPRSTEAITKGSLRSLTARGMELSLNNLLIEHNVVLGRGNFGVVYRGTLLVCPANPGPVTVVAVKAIKAIFWMNDCALQQFAKEIQVMAKLERHSNVVSLLGVVLEGTPLIVMEFCRFGSLGKYLATVNRQRKFCCTVDENGDLQREMKMTIPPMDDSRYRVLYESSTTCKEVDLEELSTHHLLDISHQISRGMEFLAGNRVIHRDLAGRNVLVCENKNVKIADFGLARQQRLDYIMRDRQAELPMRWMAPESLRDLVFNEKTDVWSFGVLLWEIFSLGEIPCKSPGQDDLLQPKTAAWIGMLQRGHRLGRPPGAPLQLFSLMQTCWSERPEDRPDFRKLRISLQPFNRDGEPIYLEPDGST